MPKTNLGKDTRDMNIIGTIAKYCALRGVTKSELMKLVDLKRTTFYSRMDEPRTFKLDEIRIIFDYLKIPKEERGGII